ncbi:hypothetical protein B9Z55_011224 [Caenorhabditis nigoni]|nr:hypothetical protein B9Z55_011224 [Caenorhabditis nigoni]
MKGSGQDGTQYKPGGILLICTYPEEHGICGHVNNIAAIPEHFSAHTKCFRFKCKCGKQFAEPVSVWDHQGKCDVFDCHSLTTTREQEEEHRSAQIKYIKNYVPPKIQLLKFRLVPPTNQELEYQNLDIAIQNEEKGIQNQDLKVQETTRDDQKETESIECEDKRESDQKDQISGPIADDSSNPSDPNQDASQTSHSPEQHNSGPKSSSFSPQDPIENPENFHNIDSEEDEYPIFGRPVTPSDEAAAYTTAESHDRNLEDQNRAAEQLDQSEAIYEDMDLQDETDEPAYGDPRFNEIVDYFPSTKRRRV